MSAKTEGQKLTPMMAQYQAMRRSLPDDILLLYRLGDFYEMFFEDAQNAAGILNVALTKRNGIPMCGVPHHAAQGYIAKLIRAGKRVAMAEQTSEPQPGKIVEREIAQIISPSTIDDLTLLDDTRHNYLAAVFRHGKSAGLACVDHTTGEFTIAELAEIVIEMTNSKSKLTSLPLPSDDPTQRRPDISLAKEQLGWEPKVSLHQGLKKTIEYFAQTL